MASKPLSDLETARYRDVIRRLASILQQPEPHNESAAYHARQQLRDDLRDEPEHVADRARLKAFERLLRRYEAALEVAP